MKAIVHVEKTVSRIVEVNIPDDVMVQFYEEVVRDYIDNYIHGHMDNSYDWNVNDITEDNTTIVDYNLHKE